MGPAPGWRPGPRASGAPGGSAGGAGSGWPGAGAGLLSASTWQASRGPTRGRSKSSQEVYDPFPFFESGSVRPKEFSKRKNFPRGFCKRSLTLLAVCPYAQPLPPGQGSRTLKGARGAQEVELPSAPAPVGPREQSLRPASRGPSRLCRPRREAGSGGGAFVGCGRSGGRFRTRGARNWGVPGSPLPRTAAPGERGARTAGRRSRVLGGPGPSCLLVPRRAQGCGSRPGRGERCQRRVHGPPRPGALCAAGGPSGDPPSLPRRSRVWGLSRIPEQTKQRE